MKVTCPYHDDSTASMELYPDGKYFCFGCAAKGPIGNLPAYLANAAPTEAPARAAENLKETLAYIDTLPIARIRGLDLPTDGYSYYVVWPSRDYYNRRFMEGDVKYRCPTGHTKLLFWANRTYLPKQRLLIVEGEINALSLALALPDVDICSPGGAGDFHSKTGLTRLQEYAEYKEIYLVVDQDAAGVIAAIELKARLEKYVPNTHIVAVTTDANDWLVQHGAEALRKEIIGQTGMDLPEGLSCD